MDEHEAGAGVGGDGRPHLLELRRIQRGVETLGDGLDGTHSVMTAMRAQQDEERKALEAQRLALDARRREAEEVFVERDHLLEEVDSLSREKLQLESLLKGSRAASADKAGYDSMLRKIETTQHEGDVRQNPREIMEREVELKQE